MKTLTFFIKHFLYIFSFNHFCFVCFVCDLRLIEFQTVFALISLADLKNPTSIYYRDIGSTLRQLIRLQLL